MIPAPAELVQGDLLQPVTLPEALHGIDAVVHLAISVTANREIQLAETVQGTTNLCDAMVVRRRHANHSLQQPRRL